MKIGQEVFIKRIGNAARHIKNPNDLISKEIVESVGKKYFKLKNYRREKFSIKDMRDVSDYSSNYLVYESEQQIKDEMETNKIRKFIESYPFGKLSLERLKEIEQMLKDSQ